VGLTGYLEALVQELLGEQVTIVTPADPEARGAALSLRVHVNRDRAWAVFKGLRRRGIVPDWREPDVIRAAPVPFYNSFDDVWCFADALRAELAT
jgi:kynureninase